jgi:threonine dehydrogenase-like Zn-dependent dehydrogenase
MEMRAAVIAGPKTVRLQTQERPEPARGQVRVRLEGTGLCGSNLVPWEGRPWFEYPMPPGSPGHEGWGHVDAVGAGVRDVREGDRVAFLSGHALADYDLAAADQLLPLPTALRNRPFPAEALGCAMNIFERSDVQAGQTVAIVGAGFLGTLLIQLCRKAGAQVIAISRRPYSREIARTHGAHLVLDADALKEEVIAQVRTLTGEGLCERVIEVVGMQAPLDLAAELCAERGRLVIAGYHQDGPRQVNLWLWNWRGLDVINAHERDPARYRHGMELALEAVLSGRIDPFPLFTHEWPLEQTNRAFEHLAERPAGFMKALVRMD